MSIGLGFAEILVICVIALIVVGPERLPGLVRNVGRFVGRARRMAQSMQYELERELDVNDIAGDRAADAKPDATVTPHPKYGQLPERVTATQDLPPEDPLDDDVPTEGHADEPPPSDLETAVDADTADAATDERVQALGADHRGG